MNFQIKRGTISHIFSTHRYFICLCLELFVSFLFPFSFNLFFVFSFSIFCRFKSSSTGLLLATDVAARGLDIPAVEHVIHYQVPKDPDVSILSFSSLSSLLAIREFKQGPVTGTAKKQ